MTLIRIPTHSLVGMLADLLRTTADPKNLAAASGVLLHTDRGHIGAEPGRTDLLIGTSTDGYTAGQAHDVCSGQQLPHPVLVHGSDAAAVVASFRPLGKDREHTVTVELADGQVTIAEDPDLIGDGLALRFHPAEDSDYPRTLTAAMQPDPFLVVERDGATVDPTLGTAYPAPRLAPFVAVAKRRNETLIMYRHHQDRPVVIAVGYRYRGLLVPQRDTDGMLPLNQPDVPVYDPWPTPTGTEPID